MTAEYFLVHFDGQMGFVYASDDDAAIVRAARKFGRKLEDCRDIDIKVDTLDNATLADVKHILNFGGYVPSEVREHFGI